MYKISIIIPTYNSEKYIEKVLNSILTQNYSNYEIIIVNDGSTDNTLKILEEKYLNNNCIKLITISNSGPGIARKIGFENASGDLLFFIDSDDFLPNKDVLSNINSVMEKNPCDLLTFNFYRKAKNKEKITNIFFNTTIKEGMYDEEFLKKNRIEGALWGKIFVRSLFKSEYFCESKNYEDYYSTYRYLNECKKIYFTQQIFYYTNRDNGNSISKIYDDKKIIDTMKLLKEIKNFSKYQDVVNTMICQFYTFSKNKFFEGKICDTKNIRECFDELKKELNYKSLFKVKRSMKILLKLMYIKLKEIKNERK